MKRLQSILCASVLTLAMTATAFAGNISVTKAGNISVTKAGNISVTAAGNISVTESLVIEIGLALMAAIV